MRKVSPLSSMPHQFGHDDIRIVSSDLVYDGYFKLLRYDIQHRCFSGNWTKTLSRELFERGHAVAILPYDPVSDEIVLIEQIRLGAIAAGLTPWQLEIVAGVIEKDELPDEVAFREMKEETGLDIIELTPMLRYLSSSGGSSETIQLYLGIVDARMSQGIYGRQDENEDILVHRISRKTALQWLTDGKIENAASIIALQWLSLNLKPGDFSSQI